MTTGAFSDFRENMARAGASDSTAMRVADEAKAAVATVAATVAKAAPVWRANVTISYTALISIDLSPREATFNIAEAKVGDRIQIFRTARPTFGGVALVGGFILDRHTEVFEDGKVPVTFQTSVVGLTKTLLAPLLLVAYRDV